MSGDGGFSRLRPRSQSSSDLQSAVAAQANQHALSEERLGRLEAAVRGQGVIVEEIRLWTLRRNYDVKRLAAVLGLCGALVAPACTALVNYVTRPAAVSAAVIAPRSGFDRAIEACNAIPDAAVRGKCVVDVAVANSR